MFADPERQKGVHVSAPVKGMPSTGPLATLLRGETDDDIVRGLNLRGISPGGIRDFYDLAELLLSTESLQHCLTRLDRRALTVLTELSKGPLLTKDIHSTYGMDAVEQKRLHTLFLVHEGTSGITAWPEVGAHLAAWPSLGLPDPNDTTPEPGVVIAGNGHSQTVESLATERAFTATTAIAELLFDLEQEPLRLLATGAVGRPGARKLAELLRVDEAAVASLIDIAENASLAGRANGWLVPSDHHREWLDVSPAERWVKLANAWAEAHWPDIRARISERHFAGSKGLTEWLSWNYPGGRDWLPKYSASRLNEAELLGITANSLLSTPGALLLRRETDAAISILAAALPTPIDRLYLQHDLTAVAPGPLQSHIDTRLRSMADVDGHAIASRYRFTNASITRAINSGETATTILDFLGAITLSGIPQPIEYLVTETAARHGLLRVGPLPTGDRQAVAYIRSDDAVLLRTVLVDRNLAALRLRLQGSDHLVSACDRDQLYAMLFAAKYPVAAEDSHGNIVKSEPAPHTARAPQLTVTTTTAPPLRALVSRMRVADAGTPEDSDEAWLVRQLDSAIRARSTVTVSVRMPNGTIVDYRLEPASVSGGRLRARDALSEIERTLPLSSIAAVTSN